jgi:hypothetical protein
VNTIGTDLEERAEEVAGVPLLRLRPANRAEESALPLVIAVHGFGGSKMQLLEAGRRIARLGCDVLLVDARLHGARRPYDFERRFYEDFPSAFGRVVEETAEDVRMLIDRCASPGVGVALVGVSMGAWISYLAASEDRRVTVLCPLIGSPYFYWQDYAATPAEQERIAARNVAAHPERLTHCALLIQHGEQDMLVPITPDRELYERLHPLYRDRPERLRFVTYPSVGHEVTPAMTEEVTVWLRKFLLSC